MVKIFQSLRTVVGLLFSLTAFMYYIGSPHWLTFRQEIQFCEMVTQAAFISTAAEILYLGTNLGRQSGLDLANLPNRGYVYHYLTCAFYNLLFAFFQPPSRKQFIK